MILQGLVSIFISPGHPIKDRNMKHNIYINVEETDKEYTKRIRENIKDNAGKAFCRESMFKSLNGDVIANIVKGTNNRCSNCSLRNTEKCNPDVEFELINDGKQLRFELLCQVTIKEAG